MSAADTTQVYPKAATLARWRRSARDDRGIAAVEFALILPLMLLVYMGASDVTRGVLASRDVDLLSRTISDLVAQQTTATSMQSSTITTIFTTAAAIMSPYDITNVTMTVSAIDIKADSSNMYGDNIQAVVRWSYTQSSTPSTSERACSPQLVQVGPSVAPSAANIPKSLLLANQSAGYNYAGGQSSYVIVADVTYTYVPFFSQATGWFSGGMRKTTFMVPRAVSNPINLATPVSAPSGQAGTVC